AYPGILLLLVLLLPAGVWLALRAERERRAALERFGEPELLARASALPDARRSAIRWAGRLGAIGFGVLALARPQFGERSAELARTGRDVLVLLDLSRSMNVADPSLRSGPLRSGPLRSGQIPVTRLAAAKQAAWGTVSAAPGDRVGLVVFGGSGFLQLPLTSDQASLRLFLDAATTDDLGDPATDVSAALMTAARVFEHEGERGRRAVLLLSDGESGEGDLDAAIAVLRSKEIPVFAIGVGSAAGGPVPADSSEAPEPYHRDHIGRVVVSRLEEADLRRAAEATGGGFARSDRGDELRRLTAALGRVESRTLAARRARERADRFQWPLAVAIALLVLAGWGRTVTLNEVKGTYPGAWPLRFAQGDKTGIAMLAIMLLACAGDARTGERLYQSGSYAEAHQAFHRGFTRDSTPALVYNAGNALYRMRRYEDAVKRYRATGAGAERLRQRSAYNLGNALVRAAEEAPERAEPLRQAIAAYEEALRLDPTDADAKWNLELALERLGDDRTSGGSSGRGRSADYGRGDMNVPGYEGTPDAAVGAMAGGGFGAGEGESVEELSAEQARRLLETVQRQQLSSHEGRPSERGPTGERDW
ncbi:MAG: VWA domain-containing protein, partial [Gemmatimonadales bacterium]